MVVIPKGTFLMGSPDKEGPGPVHKVSIGYDFAVGKYPVTRGEWRRYLSDSGREGGTDRFGFDPKTGEWDFKEEYCWSNPGYPQDDSHPVVCVTWQEATEYAAWMSEKTGERYRLLSEAEYEYILRAGSQAAYPWGDEVQDMHLYTQQRGGGRELAGTWPVGRFKPNAFGLHDTTGLVGCWTQDCYHTSYYGAPQDGSAWPGEDDDERAVRGGGWDDKGECLRSAYRSFGDLAYVIGLRLARDSL
jgi:formylglycine-generating enzyme required for sulfatase activity